MICAHRAADDGSLSTAEVFWSNGNYIRAQGYYHV